jgi:DNA-binding transcriptional MocR family regulator
VLLALLDDPSVSERLALARAEYARRRAAVTDVLSDRGVPFTGSDGINLWMEVADERSALITLAARGIGAAPGEPFMVRDDTPHLRLTVGLLGDTGTPGSPSHDPVAVAEALADAAGFTPRRAGQR